MSKFSNHPAMLMLFALSFSFLLMMVFSPMLGVSQLVQQWDFVVLWLISLLTIALPMLYLELALAKRSQNSALQGLMSLTRDADAKTTWRVIGWAGIVFIALLNGSILSQIALNIGQIFNVNLHFSVLMLIGLGVALALSCLPRLLLVCGMLGAMLASMIITPSSDINTQLQWTNGTAQDWATSVMMVVLATGFGMSVYWQNSVKMVENSSSLNLPVFALLGALCGAMILYTVVPTQSVIALLAVVALLLQLSREQLQQRQMAIVLQWLLPCVGVLVWLIAPLHQTLGYVLMILGLLLCLAYSIFVGWVMKASHLRKSLNFNKELIYNVWRVAVRIVVPLQIIIALGIMLQHWLA